MSTHDHTEEWDSFNDLVTWACWHLLESITSGRPLRGAVHHVIEMARRAKFKQRAQAQQKGPA
ncbi:hypothetical protein [Delftia sp.]|uniref:hypothetical protein n=1 Tax=Delftia sp. TaxID=1886637 RepID=UPI00257E7694|nr:hypothetical protein [Delftia sp.]MPT55021.1 hypothetical protein [Delftia sp.]